MNISSNKKKQKDMKKIIIIDGSPRRNMNTAQMLQKFAEGAKSAGEHIEPDILECEVKCALRSITKNKASGGDGIPVELFQILKGLSPHSGSSWRSRVCIRA